MINKMRLIYVTICDDKQDELRYAIILNERYQRDEIQDGKLLVR